MLDQKPEGVATSADPVMATFLRHATAEAQLDVEATMATFAANPRWELEPLGLLMEGSAAIREFYRRTLASLNDCLEEAEQTALYAGVDHLVTEYLIAARHPDGVVRPTKLLALFTFSGPEVTSERVYTDLGYAHLYAIALGSDFLQFPGVNCRDVGLWNSLAE